MQTIAVNRLKPEPDSIGKAAAVLRQGGIVVHPTETCYGFAVAVDQGNAASVERLYALKKMDRTKPISLLVGDLQQAQMYGVFTDRVRDLVAVFWPGPLTVIVPRTDCVPLFINSGHSTIAMRVPSCPVSLGLIRAVGAVTTTSANVSTQPSPYSIAEFLAQFSDNTNATLPSNLILDGGVLSRVLPSTIIDTTVSPWKIVREGPVTRASLENFLL